MSQLKVLHYPNPFLRKKSKSVRRVTPEIKKLAENMLETMYEAPGVGLAAPQVGKLIRLIVVDIGDNPIVFINPKIIKKSGKQTFNEGCLCLPGVEAPIERSAHVLVEGWNKNGCKQEIEAQGLLATVLQHEIDHLEGVIFIDRVKNQEDIKYSHAKNQEDFREIQ